MPKTSRRIKKANIRFLSLCTAGANGFTSLYKSFQGLDEDGSFEFSTLSKEMSEEGEIISLVYAPESTDLEGDVASAEVIKEMCYSFSKNKGDIDIRHDGKPVGTDRAYVAQSFIVQKGDPRFEGFKDKEGNEVDAEGGWAVAVKLADENLRKLYREGTWDGISMGGEGKVEVLKSDDSSDAMSLLRGIAKLFKLSGGSDDALNPEKEEKDMKPEEVNKTVEEAIKKAIPTIVEQVKKANASTEGFTGDLNDKEALRKHLEALDAKDANKVDLNDPESLKKQLAKLEAASLDLTDPTQVKKHLESLEAKKKGENPQLQEALKKAEDASKEVERLKKQSNQSILPGGQGETTSIAKSVKEMADMGSYAGR